VLRSSVFRRYKVPGPAADGVQLAAMHRASGSLANDRD